LSSELAPRHLRRVEALIPDYPERLRALHRIDATRRDATIQVFGTRSNAVTELLRHQAGAGVPLSVKPHHLGGFTR